MVDQDRVRNITITLFVKIAIFSQRKGPSAWTGLSFGLTGMEGFEGSGSEWRADDTPEPRPGLPGGERIPPSPP